MEILDPTPPDQEWENGAFWLSFCLILDFWGDGGLLFHFILSKITVLGRIVKKTKFRPPSPQIKEGKMARFAFREATSFFRGGGGGTEGGRFAFPFYSVQDGRTLLSGLLTAIDAPFF